MVCHRNLIDEGCRTSDTQHALCCIHLICDKQEDIIESCQMGCNYRFTSGRR